MWLSTISSLDLTISDSKNWNSYHSANGSLKHTEATVPRKMSEYYLMCPVSLFLLWMPPLLLDYWSNSVHRPLMLSVNILELKEKFSLPKKLEYIKPSLGTPFLWSHNHLMTGTWVQWKEHWTESQELCTSVLLLAGSMTLSKSFLLASVHLFNEELE